MVQTELTAAGNKLATKKITPASLESTYTDSALQTLFAHASVRRSPQPGNPEGGIPEAKQGKGER